MRSRLLESVVHCSVEAVLYVCVTLRVYFSLFNQGTRASLRRFIMFTDIKIGNLEAYVVLLNT